jgi:hypothetical protein
MITYGYDAMSWLTDIKNPNNQVIAHYAYDELSRRTALYYNYDGDGACLRTSETRRFPVQKSGTPCIP